MDGDSERAAVDTMAQSSKTLRSPKGLIGVTKRRAHEGEDFKVEKIGPSAFKWTTREVTGDTIRAYIANLRNWVTDIGFSDSDETTSQEPPRKKARRSSEASAFADRTYWAGRVLKKLDDVERDLIEIERSSDADAVRRNSLTAIHNAVVLASEIHSLTVADFEGPIVTGTAVSRRLNDASAAANIRRHARQSHQWEKWNAAAREIWKRNQNLSHQAVAGLVKANLRLDVAVRTIAKRLKKVGTAG